MMERECFSGEEKECMVRELIQSSAARETSVKNAVLTRKKYKMARGMKEVVAACLIGALLLTGVTGANASELLKSVPDVFGQIFKLSGDDKELAEEMGTSLGNAAVAKGIRVTADAVLADSYAYAVVFSIEREDGKTLGDAEALTPDGWGFDSFKTKNVNQKEGDTAWGRCYSYDENPKDAAIQYVMIFSNSQERKAGDIMTICLSDLHHLDKMGGRDYTENGDWSLEISIPKSLGKAVDSGEKRTVNVEGNEFVIDQISISPLSYHLVISMKKDNGVDAENAADLLLEQCVMELELKDGEKIVLEDGGYAVKENGSSIQFVYGHIFRQLFHLDEIKAIRIGSLEIPVSFE